MHTCHVDHDVQTAHIPRRCSKGLFHFGALGDVAVIVEGAAAWMALDGFGNDLLPQRVVHIH
ncbi:hypothetical protein D3C78_1030650 [compost metagenome]